MNDHSMLKTGAIESEEIVPDILSMRTVMVNIQMIGLPSSGDWVLVDSGLGNFEEAIAEAAEKRFARPPVCIVLTHGHFVPCGQCEGRLVGPLGAYLSTLTGTKCRS
ncbi:beta-lactamase domain protein [Paenibacillus vortex V453]|uniref:Beta-lactamase domain protein n=1 Tax=Paenibacillus vortex V453 TaxID=715225 RepID=A0A2R9SYV0_9BACL|nr:beta-lactamase domain protein [Paenibacillus vortex V453]